MLSHRDAVNCVILQGERCTNHVWCQELWPRPAVKDVDVPALVVQLLELQLLHTCTSRHFAFALFLKCNTITSTVPEDAFASATTVCKRMKECEGTLAVCRT